ncbi:hypothetical protein Nepgr_033344 [Nepenthes gracilis]|uniref:Uncharacterized protein n=1 Tax=Nepenthes gracilis TaxID=150966 RepID=A0AAD3Y8X6_NEPGR|nr:hypothetical protein Nepgr_033344 [Nepenthes gracilis]
MDALKRKLKRALQRSKSSRQSHQPAESNQATTLHKSPSWPSKLFGSSPLVGRRSRQLTPQGYFSVYVGPERRRFLVDVKHASHPLFKVLLEDAESEYGYSCEGPLLLPCDVDLFYRVLAEMGSDDIGPAGCGINLGNGNYSPLSPSKLWRINQF